MPTYPCIHEDEVHLHEGEDHLEQRIDAAQDLVAGRRERNLEEGAQLQARVDHRAQAKGYHLRVEKRTITDGQDMEASREQHLFLPIAPTRKKKLPCESFWVVFRLRWFFGVTTAFSTASGWSWKLNLID